MGALPKVFEAALGRAVMLVLRDGWNLIEEWFVPGEEFLQWCVAFSQNDGSKVPQGRRIVPWSWNKGDRFDKGVP